MDSLSLVEARVGDGAVSRRYRFDFALIILTGNITRYRILRPRVEDDTSVDARWFPIRTWFAADPLSFLPGSLRLRLRHILDTHPLYLPSRADATLIHAFETYYLYTIAQRLLGRKVAIVNNPDGGLPVPKGQWLRDWQLRFAVRETDAFVFWSQGFAKQAKELYPSIQDEKIHVIHPGIDLESWSLRPPREPGERFRLLFVGGDLLRKGADTLLDAYEKYLTDTCELHIATQSAYMPREFRERAERLPNVHLHLDYTSGSEPLRALFRESDAFVLPTKNDVSSWVAIESLATGLPVIISAVGGIPEIVVDEETGLLIPPGSPEAVAAAVNRLRTSPELREKCSRQGRAHVEANFDAAKNTARLLSLMKSLSDVRHSR
ncbi:MAG: glycosyltransferase family 4 protein [Fibrella sp.]|nr:glycosyltransferase family 4 protein [Armatimonadota bacterium]